MTPVQYSLNADPSFLTRPPCGENSFDKLQQTNNRMAVAFQNAINFCNNQRNSSYQEIHYYSEILESFNGFLEEYLLVEARARFLYYTAIYNFLGLKKREKQISDIPVIAVLKKPRLDEIILEVSLKEHQENLGLLNELLDKNEPSCVEASTNFDTFESNARLLYHEQMYYKIQSMLSVLHQERSFNHARLLVESPAELLKSTKNTETTPAATQVQPSPNLEKTRSQQPKKSDKRLFRGKQLRRRKRDIKPVSSTNNKSPALAAKESSQIRTAKKTARVARFCGEFLAKGRCKRGNSCWLAHRLVEIKTPRKINERCMYGPKCLKLTKCPYSHTDEELRKFEGIIKYRNM